NPKYSFFICLLTGSLPDGSQGWFTIGTRYVVEYFNSLIKSGLDKSLTDFTLKWRNNFPVPCCRFSGREVRRHS
ncbi:MAG TPA: hypothetical protein VFI29_01015, partial [Hanamia sp.]|nr:hypothetical protein [Hanamia sp.]